MAIYQGENLTKQLDGVRSIQPLVGKTGVLDDVVKSMGLQTETPALQIVTPREPPSSWNPILGGGISPS